VAAARQQVDADEPEGASAWPTSARAREQVKFAEEMKKNPARSTCPRSVPEGARRRRRAGVPAPRQLGHGPCFTAGLPLARRGTRQRPDAQLTQRTERTPMLQAYVEHVAERAALGIPPLPLTPSRPPK
jgi:hypothetical protein